MSRFDLFFVVLDDCDEATDMAIADHIVSVHQGTNSAGSGGAAGAGAGAGAGGAAGDGGGAVQPGSRDDIFSAERMQRYIRYAKSLQPMISPEAQQLFVSKYRDLRDGDSQVSSCLLSLSFSL